MNLSIVNLNCWLLPGSLAADSKKRLPAIADLILEYNPDIVTLQEVWQLGDLRYLKERLSEYHCVSSGTRVYNHGGLGIFSKIPITRSKVTFFPLTWGHNPIEWIARKGYVEAELTIGENTFTIVNTHLYAPYSKKSEYIPERQLTQLLSNVSGRPSIVCGDFNLSENEFEKVTQNKLVRVCNSENTFDTLNPYKQPKSNILSADIEGGKIDYMTYANLAIRDSQFKILKTPIVSDHYGMYCTLVL